MDSMFFQVIEVNKNGRFRDPKYHKPDGAIPLTWFMAAEFYKVS